MTDCIEILGFFFCNDLFFALKKSFTYRKEITQRNNTPKNSVLVVCLLKPLTKLIIKSRQIFNRYWDRKALNYLRDFVPFFLTNPTLWITHFIAFLINKVLKFNFLHELDPWFKLRKVVKGSYIYVYYMYKINTFF